MHILFIYFISSCNGSDTHAKINIYIYVAQYKPIQQSYKFMDLVKSYTLLSDQLWFLKSWVWSSKTPNSDPKSQCPSNVFFLIGRDRYLWSSGEVRWLTKHSACRCRIYIYIYINFIKKNLNSKDAEFKRWKRQFAKQKTHISVRANVHMGQDI